jgi:Mlc titration factor MtfA (ptsG expression regulator)
MTNEQKLIAVVAILPVMADLLEDVKIFRMVKIHGNKFIDEVRKVDNTIIKDAELEAQSQQVNIQRAFLQWLKTEFVAQ